jgi:hypothetical protein
MPIMFLLNTQRTKEWHCLGCQSELNYPARHSLTLPPSTNETDSSALTLLLPIQPYQKEFEAKPQNLTSVSMCLGS